MTAREDDMRDVARGDSKLPLPLTAHPETRSPDEPLAAEELRRAVLEAVVDLPQPTLGLAGGVNRGAVVDAVNRVFAAALAVTRPEPDLDAAVGKIAALTEDDVRDYEQGLCFFCGASSEPIPGPRGGIKGDRRRRPVHEPACPYVVIRATLRSTKPG